MKANSTIKFLMIILCLAGLVMTANAQKKKTTTKKTTSATAPSTINNAAEIRAGADKVSMQIKNVSRFVYLLGGIARTIEDLDAEARTRKISQASVDANNKNKQAVIQGIQNLRAGLLALETEFRTKPGLKLYAVRVDGISNLVADAEGQASAGQIVESGKTLLLVIERLSDALAALP
ncbi:MAG TPA: hypothetical protein PKY82_24980 [Pyrinomonadaceae bacterium]|nr:hypothetical protein [Pyrinomonadaceae bacterium]